MRRRLFLFAGLAGILLAACALYVPFLGNRPVFDDLPIFSSLEIYDWAQVPFSLAPRTFPYFTLGFTEVMGHSIEAHRIVSLVLHLLNVLLVFRLLDFLLRRIDGLSAENAAAAALLATGAFALHPVAVYGAGYLVQRPIVFATLFSLLSLWFYLRGLSRNRFADLVTAALMYSLAVLSKEHAVMLPFAAAALSPLAGADWRRQGRKIATYLLLCAPAALWVVLLLKGVVGVRYEPDASSIARQIGAGGPGGGGGESGWLLSATTQMGLLFDYLRYWWLPDVRSLSIDMRVDFAAGAGALAMGMRLFAFLACPLLAIRLLRAGGRRALFGGGLAYVWLLYLPELATVRFQEPLVLYRSYLWAPGYLLMIAATLSLLGRRGLAIAALAGLPLLFTLAHDRLDSLRDDLHAWQDAAAKLPDDNLPGAARIFYNRGRELLRAKRYGEAMADMDRVIAREPDMAQAYANKGGAAMGLGDYGLALECVDRALRLDGKDGALHYARGLALERLDRVTEARAAYARSLALGYLPAKLRLAAPNP